MTESTSIYLYLLNKYVPELLGKTEQAKIKVMEGLFVLVSIKQAITDACYVEEDPLTASK